jgi:hypothetical protein
VQAAINAGDFNRLFAGINRAAAEEIVMLDRQKRIVAHTAMESPALGQPYIDLAALGADDDKLFSLAAVGDYPFDIVVMSSRDEALKTWRERSAYGVSIVFLMLVLVILLVFWQRNYNLACTTASEMAQAFDDAEHQARQLLDSVPIRPGCVTATVSSSPSMRPISGSAGKSRAEVIGKKVYDVWPARMAATFGARDEQIIALARRSMPKAATPWRAARCVTTNMN